MDNKCTSVMGTSGIVRPRFGPGMLLQHEDLELIVDYSTSLYRLVFRSLLGSGVICGLEVALSTSTPPVITVQPGIALDGEGYPIYVPSPQSIRTDPCKPWTAAGVVVLRRQPSACANRIAACAGGDNTMVPTREIEGFELAFISSTPEEVDALVEKLLVKLEAARCSLSSNAGWVILAKLHPNATDKVVNTRPLKVIRDDPTNGSPSGGPPGNPTNGETPPAEPPAEPQTPT